MKRFFFIFSFTIISLFSFSQSIEGKWNFDYILPETIEIGENLKPISDGDAMQINADGSFHYKISKAELIADGSWELNENNLSFYYILPKEMTRTYQIISNDNSLVLNENGINYAFVRSKITPTIIATSEITFTSIFRGILGIISLLLIAFLFSRNRKGINWALVIKGLSMQILFALLILKVSLVSSGFEFVGKIFTKIISFTQDGTMFLFKSFETGLIESPLMNFVVMILPTVIFFSALTSLFYYWKIIPKIVYGFAWLMKRTMLLSGPESVAAAGNIFLGQTESPLLVKPYLDKMTMSEMLCLMSGGMATIAGGVLAAYIGFLGGDDPVQQIMFAKHLLAASVMSAPAAVVAAKILLPETEEFEEKLEITSAEVGSNALEAISKGTTDGLRLAVNVGAMLIGFIALIAVIDLILNWLDSIIDGYLLEGIYYQYTASGLTPANGEFSGYFPGSLQTLFGTLLKPLAFIMGTPSSETEYVGHLLGIKLSLNEFVAYGQLGDYINNGLLSDRGKIIATYALCGFANFSSIGIQIGGISALAPKRKADVARIGLRAMFGGAIASWLTATIAGLLI